MLLLNHASSKPKVALHYATHTSSYVVPVVTDVVIRKTKLPFKTIPDPIFLILPTPALHSLGFRLYFDCLDFDKNVK